MGERRKASGPGGALVPPAPSASERETLDASVARLSGLNMDQLRLQWRNHLGGIAPAHVPGWLLMRVLAYRIQAAAFGDLDRAILRRLREPRDEAFGSGDARPFATRGPTTREGIGLNSGALLVREWNGRLERVMILDDGYAWNGCVYRSLSQVAKAITGTIWNGHRFFGLKAVRNGASSRKMSAAPRLNQLLDIGISPALTAFAPAMPDRSPPLVTPHLKPELVREAVAAASAIGDEPARSRALAALAPHLASQQLSQALAAAKVIGDEHELSQTLAALASHPAPHQTGEALSDAPAAAKAISDEVDRLRTLTTIASYLGPQERDAALHDILEVAKAISDADDRLRTLIALVKLVPGNLKSDTLLAMIDACGNVRRKEALSAVQAGAPATPELGGQAAILELNRTIRDIGRWYP